ncbi:MAG: antibiotic biosynthesis monooxygenase [Xanthomonadales bacterium]|nr:antibiotic biosynthesis monooxygenase [Xanthomonadales bacterium]
MHAGEHAPPGFAATPPPPYWQVVFTSRLSGQVDGYDEMAARMQALASARPGFLGMESARGADGLGITVSYWSDPEAIAAWKADLAHRAAQDAGIRRWYAHYTVRVARVERDYRHLAAPVSSAPGGD